MTALPLQIIWTSQFKRDYRLAMKSGRDIELLDSVIQRLANREDLRKEFGDHALGGNWLGHRELHLAPDWLLVYRVKEDVLALSLTRTGTHSQILSK